jgi:hypothetical protein
VICTVVQLVEKMGKKRETIQALRCLVCIKPVRYYPGANLSIVPGFVDGTVWFEFI